MTRGINRKPAQKERDAKLIAAKYLQGQRYRDIAEQLDIPYSTVKDHIQQLLTEWHADAIADINLAKQLELARIDQLELTYWRAWEQSLVKHKITAIKSRPVRELERLAADRLRQRTNENALTALEDDGEVTTNPGERQRRSASQDVILERLVKTEDARGNPQWLIGIQWCINKRCEILGLNAPRRVEASGPGGGPIPMETSFDLSQLSQEQLEALEMLWTTKAPNLKRK